MRNDHVLPVVQRHLRRFFSEAYVERGLRYYVDRHVLHIDQNVNLITAIVQSSGRSQYVVSLQFYGDTIDQANFDCECPLGGACKHVIATLFQSVKNGMLGITPAGFLPANVPNGMLERDSAASSTPLATTYSAETLMQIWTKSLPSSLREKAPSVGKSKTPLRKLYYCLSLSEQSITPELNVDLFTAVRTKNGNISQQHSLAAYRVLQGSSPKYVRELDKEIVSLLVQLGDENFDGSFGLDLNNGAYLMERILRGKQAVWGDPSNDFLALGETRQATASWQKDGESLSLRYQVMDQEHTPPRPSPDCFILPLLPLWYLDLRNFCIGPLQCEEEPTEALMLHYGPPMPISDIKAVEKIWQRQTPVLAERYPLKQWTQLKSAKGTLTPVLEIHSDQFGNSLISDLDFAAAPQPYFHLRFAYQATGKDAANVEAPFGSSEGHITVLSDSSVLNINRYKSAEKKHALRLQKFGFLPANTKNNVHLNGDNVPWILPPADHPKDARLREQWNMEFMDQGIAELEAEGWSIRQHEHDVIEVTALHGEWDGQLAESEENGSKNDAWFSVDLGIDVDGERVPLLPILMSALKIARWDEASHTFLLPEGLHQVYVQVDKKRWYSLSRARIEPLLKTLAHLFAAGTLGKDGKLTLEALDAVLLAELQGKENDAIAWQGQPASLKLWQRLKDVKGMEKVTLPKTIKAKVRDYQREGVRWLQFLRDNKLGGILADDMGLGKTLQTLIHLEIERKSGRANSPSLVVAPTSVAHNWAKEAARFAPHLKVAVLHGPERHRLFSEIDKYDLLVTTYSLLLRDQAILGERCYHLLILDEAQMIKNPDSKFSQEARALKAEHRVCLTGTPMENNLGEVWALFDFLIPGYLGTRRQFNERFRKAIEKDNDPLKQDELRTRLAPFMLRRDKSKVANELPDKTEIVQEIELSGKQRELYESVRLVMHKKVREQIAKQGLGKSHLGVLDALLKLRQTCCDPALLPADLRKDIEVSAKLDRLMQLLGTLLSSGHRVLLFSQFTSMLALVEKRLKQEKIEYVQLTGSTKNRQLPCDRFQNHEVPLMLISLKAGGTGLNLTAADTVIHYDPWWNPSAERQATDRAHRIGQDRKVFVYKLIVADTVESKILDMQKRKQALADALFSGKANTQAKFGLDDIDQLLGGSPEAS